MAVGAGDDGDDFVAAVTEHLAHGERLGEMAASLALDGKTDFHGFMPATRDTLPAGGEGGKGEKKTSNIQTEARLKVEGGRVKEKGPSLVRGGVGLARGHVLERFSG